MRTMAAVLIASVAAVLSGCHIYNPSSGSETVQRPSAVMDFAALYGNNCAACHGADGANGPAMDLANPEYQALVDDATLRKWIGGGMPGTQMPAFAKSNGGMLTDAQVNAIIAGMRQRWSRPGALEGTQPPPYTDSRTGDAGRGAQTYQARCAICHKQGREDISSPVYLALVSDQTFRTMIIAGSPDIGQPDWRHDSADGKLATPLSAQDINDIIAYLDGLRNASPGFTGTATASQSGAPAR